MSLRLWPVAEQGNCAVKGDTEFKLRIRRMRPMSALC